MSELTTYALLAVAIVALIIGVYWLASKLIDEILPPDESLAKRDMEAMLADALLSDVNEQLSNRPRLRAGTFNNRRKS